jgi:hypothetical protein
VTSPSTPPAGYAAGALQRALYARLAGDPVLVAAGCGVWDDVPEDAAMPYLTLGEAVEVPSSSHDRPGRQVLVTLHVWSRYRGMAEANAVAGRVVELLDHQQRQIPVAGHHLVAFRFVDAVPQRDPDPLIRHVPVRFRAETFQEDQ